jgi:tetratricopeptide (TPR) repeat protein
MCGVCARKAEPQLPPHACTPQEARIEELLQELDAVLGSGAVSTSDIMRIQGQATELPDWAVHKAHMEIGFRLNAQKRYSAAPVAPLCSTCLRHPACRRPAALGKADRCVWPILRRAAVRCAMPRSGRRYHDALISYDAALQRKPDDALAFFRLGNAFFALKKFPEARKVRAVLCCAVLCANIA